MNIIDPKREQQNALRREVAQALTKHKSLHVILSSPVSGYVGELDTSSPDAPILRNVVGAIVARVPASTVLGAAGQGQLVGQLQLEPPLGGQQGIVEEMTLHGAYASYPVGHMHPRDLLALVKAYENLVEVHQQSCEDLLGAE